MPEEEYRQRRKIEERPLTPPQTNVPSELFEILKKSILEHMEKGYDVVMEANCAKTIRDDLEQVKSYGIKIADENKSYEGYTKIHLGDINIRKLSEFVLGYDLDFDIDKIEAFKTT